MFATRKRVIVALTLAVGFALVSGAAYLLKIPPFKKQEESSTIRATELCDSFGNPTLAVKTLNNVLPKESTYSFQETPGSRVDQSDATYDSSCFIRGDAKIVMSARTEMMRAESPKGWINAEVLDERGNIREYESFPAGDKGMASPMRAAIFVPCTPKGQIPGGAYNLSVTVQLKQAGKSSKPESRAELTELAMGAAKFAHQNARCGLPSKLPGKP
ncbi:hypothetical protein [Streptomyces lasiicapitis]|uniref:hypothetical protein n=1 Tax=Streptomyces lasiicapitis TaxID=1923961 RepID=UPI00364F3EA2